MDSLTFLSPIQWYHTHADPEGTLRCPFKWLVNVFGRQSLRGGAERRESAGWAPRGQRPVNSWSTSSAPSPAPPASRPPPPATTAVAPTTWASLPCFPQPDRWRCTGSGPHYFLLFYLMIVNIPQHTYITKTVVSLYIVTNYSTTGFNGTRSRDRRQICTLWVPIYLSFKNQRGHPSLFSMTYS